MVAKLERSAFAQVVAIFALILLLKWESLSQPPVWDTAMGLFPAALTLAQNGFNLVELLGMPSYATGGPNTHSTSAVTLLTALVLMLTGGGTKSFVVVHLLHFGMAALSLSALFRFARPTLGQTPASFLCLCVLLYPVFLVQVGFMYMELPLFMCAILALLAWVERRFWPAVLWATLAVAIKEVGVIVPATLVTAALLENRGWAARLRRTVQIVILPAFWWGATSVLGTVAGSGSVVRERPDYPLIIVYHTLGRYLDRFILNVPDLALLGVLFIFALVAFGRGLSGALRREPVGPKARDVDQQADLPVALSGVLILGFLALFFVALPVAATWVIILPRYAIIIIPFLFLWLGFVGQRIANRMGISSSRALITTFVVLSVFFGLNRGGRFYPNDVGTWWGPGNDFAVTERSHAYLRLNAIQHEAMAYLETLPDDAPVYYGHYEHYLFTYPELGYTQGPLSNGHNLSQESFPDPPPTCSYILYNYPAWGGEKMLEFFELVDNEPDLSREVVREFRTGRYVISLSQVLSAGATCP